MEGLGTVETQAQSLGGTWRLLVLGLAVLTMLVLGTAQPAGAQVDRVTCGFFETQADAQAALNARPELAPALDGDGDGIACEELQTGGPVVVDPVSCGFFETQADAQAALDDDPELALTLDSDGDGIACEDAFETGGPAVVVCNEAIGTLVEVSQTAIDQDSLDFPYHLATEAEVAAGECAVVVVCNEASGALIEVSDTEGVLGGLDFPFHRATEAEIAAGTCAVPAPVTPVGEGKPDKDVGGEDNAVDDAEPEEVVALPSTGAGTHGEQPSHAPLSWALLAMAIGAIALRARIRQSLA